MRAKRMCTLRRGIVLSRAAFRLCAVSLAGRGAAECQTVIPSTAREKEISRLGQIPLQMRDALGWQFADAGIGYISVLECELYGKQKITFIETRGLAGTDSCNIYHSFSWLCLFRTTKLASARCETEAFLPAREALFHAKATKKYHISVFEDRLRSLGLPVLSHSFSRTANEAANVNLLVSRRALAEYYLDMLPPAYRVTYADLTGR